MYTVHAVYCTSHHETACTRFCHTQVSCAQSAEHLAREGGALSTQGCDGASTFDKASHQAGPRSRAQAGCAAHTQAIPRSCGRAAAQSGRQARRQALGGGQAPRSSQAGNTAPVAAPGGGKQKHKLVRDSFTLPKDEDGVLVGLKQRAGNLVHHAKKSEILRAGVQLLSALPDAGFLAALKAVPSLKTGRPKQEPAAPAAAVAQGGKKQGR